MQSRPIGSLAQVRSIGINAIKGGSKVAPKVKEQDTTLYALDLESKCLRLFMRDPQSEDDVAMITESGDRIQTMILSDSVWASPTYDTLGRLYNLVSEATGLEDPLTPVQEFATKILGKDPEWVTKAIKGSSDKAKQLIAAQVIVNYQSDVTQYNADHSESLEDLGESESDLVAKLAKCKSDIQDHKVALAEILGDRVSALHVGWLANDGKMYVDSDTLKLSKSGKGKGGGSKLPRDYTAGSWTAKWGTLKTVPDVAGVLSVAKDSLESGSKIGKGDWTCLLTVKGTKDPYDSGVQETANSAFVTAIEYMVIAEIGPSDKVIRINTPLEFGIPVLDAPPVANAA